MEEQFAEFRAELDETGSVYEQLRIIAANLDSFIRLMQAALMPIHHCSFPRTNLFSFPFFFAFPYSSSSSSSIYIYPNQQFLLKIISSLRKELVL
jgi:hypothetical protein